MGPPSPDRCTMSEAALNVVPAPLCRPPPPYRVPGQRMRVRQPRVEEVRAQVEVKGGGVPVQRQKAKGMAGEEGAGVSASR